MNIILYKLYILRNELNSKTARKSKPYI